MQPRIEEISGVAQRHRTRKLRPRLKHPHLEHSRTPPQSAHTREPRWESESVGRRKAVDRVLHMSELALSSLPHTPYLTQTRVLGEASPVLQKQETGLGSLRSPGRDWASELGFDSQACAFPTGHHGDPADLLRSPASGRLHGARPAGSVCSVRLVSRQRGRGC